FGPLLARVQRRHPRRCIRTRFRGHHFIESSHRVPGVDLARIDQLLVEILHPPFLSANIERSVTTDGEEPGCRLRVLESPVVLKFHKISCTISRARSRSPVIRVANCKSGSSNRRSSSRIRSEFASPSRICLPV